MIVTAGGGLAIWTNVQGISSYWCYKAGHHAKYDSTGRDKYRQIWCNVIDDGICIGMNGDEVLIYDRGEGFSCDKKDCRVVGF